jgi:hypothetical protein
MAEQTPPQGPEQTAPSAPTGWSGHRAMTLDDLARLQPGLGRLMPEIGQRMWKLYYAAQAANWPLARYQVAEIRGLMATCAFTRPKYAEHLQTYVSQHLATLDQRLEAQDWEGFERAFRKAVDVANAYHRIWEKPFIVWKLPDMPPPDLDLRPQAGR